MSQYHPGTFNEGAGSLADTISRSVNSNRSLNSVTNALRKIYDPRFRVDEFVRYTGVDSFVIQKIQNWYLMQRLKYSYGKLHDAESSRLVNYSPEEVSHRNSMRTWRLNERHQKLVDEFQRDSHYGLKNFVEILARSIVEEKIRSTGVYRDVKVYLASDADDIVSGVDLIVDCIDQRGNRHLIGVDVAVSENSQYLDGKSEYESCSPTEFLFRNRLGPRTSIHRIVFALSPSEVAHMIDFTVDSLMQGNPVTAKTLTDKYSTKDMPEVLYGVQNLIQRLLKN
ncbi:MAG: hypothetical protein HHAS10_03430 [Candidatus Altimarinota bacterium]